MKRHFDEERDRLKSQLLRMAEEVRRMLRLCLEGLVQEADEEIGEIFELERRLNQAHRRISEEAILLIALHQPMADDLRFLVSAMAIVRELERMGDLAVNLARKVLDLRRYGPSELTVRIGAMLEVVLEMVREVTEAFIHSDTETAERILRRDDAVDQARDALTRLVIERIPGPRRPACELVEALLACRNIERIADQATNVAEEIIYLVEGRDVRHEIGESHEAPGSWEQIRRIPDQSAKNGSS